MILILFVAQDWVTIGDLAFVSLFLYVLLELLGGSTSSRLRSPQLLFGFPTPLQDSESFGSTDLYDFYLLCPLIRDRMRVGPLFMVSSSLAVLLLDELCPVFPLRSFLMPGVGSLPLDPSPVLGPVSDLLRGA